MQTGGILPACVLFLIQGCQKIVNFVLVWYTLASHFHTIGGESMWTVPIGPNNFTYFPLVKSVFYLEPWALPFLSAGP